MGCVCGCGPWRLLTPSVVVVVVVVVVEVEVVVLVLEVVAAAVCGSDKVFRHGEFYTQGFALCAAPGGGVL
ncbi:unnamed protein product [Gadus morhua 'NCC']